VRSLMPAAWLASRTFQPNSSTRSANGARPLAVNLACLWLFIRCPVLVLLELGSHSFPERAQMNNLLKHHIPSVAPPKISVQ
jgi:hypothetical protein